MCMCLCMCLCMRNRHPVRATSHTRALSAAFSPLYCHARAWPPPADAGGTTSACWRTHPWLAARSAASTCRLTRPATRASTCSRCAWHWFAFSLALLAACRRARLHTCAGGRACPRHKPPRAAHACVLARCHAPPTAPLIVPPMYPLRVATTTGVHGKVQQKSRARRDRGVCEDC
jgi:hypothetical protein